MPLGNFAPSGLASCARRAARMPGNPVKLLDRAGEPDSFTAPPLLGAQTDSVLAGLLGYAPERIEALRAGKAIA